jgi:propionyl-CoA carboxylase alpha chain
MIRRLLVANRGEIARRVFATCRAGGIETVAVHSDADTAAPHVREADTAVRLPGDAAAQTYLRVDRLVDAARRAGADAVHPGYGFLAENADFAAAVLDAGLVWVGPPPKAIAAMGAKLEAKALLAEAGVPVLPSWTDVAVPEFPVLVKASAGGGGRGMRIVRSAPDLPDALASARREALAAFGDDTVFCEPFIEPGRHVEVQVIADVHGSIVALGERECSIQRRHQKIVEESPSPAVGASLRRRLCAAAVAAGRAVGYVGAGTVEFLLAPDGRFYFLEMNTRLQVEHPVTECVLGLDLVRLQLLVAEGERLPFTAAPKSRGHAIEVRLYAEDPTQDWRPSTGTLHRFAIGGLEHAFAPPPAGGPEGWLRTDSGVADGSVVGPHYDPMLAKVIAWAPSRAEAARRLATALRGARIHGLATNRDLLVRVLASEEFLAGGTDTAFLDRHPEVFAPLLAGDEMRWAALAAALAGAARRRRDAPGPALPPAWRNVPSAAPPTTLDTPSGLLDVRYRLGRDAALVAWSVDAVRSADAAASVDGPAEGAGRDRTGAPAVTLRAFAPDEVVLEVDGVRRGYSVHRVGDTSYVDGPAGSAALVQRPRFPLPEPVRPAGSLLAPVPGAVGRIAVRTGQRVEAGDLLLTLEAMKLDHPVRAPAAGVVAALPVHPGSQVDAGTVLAIITPLT